MNLYTYSLKLIMAGIICAISLIYNSENGVIGSMLISPLFLPILLLQNDLNMGMTSLLSSIIILVIVGFVTQKIVNNKKSNPVISNRSTNINLLKEFISAFLISCVFIFSTHQTFDFGLVELVGANIAISLLPPFVNAGVLIGKNKFTESFNSFNLGFFNVFGAIIAMIFINVMHNMYVQ